MQKNSRIQSLALIQTRLVTGAMSSMLSFVQYLCVPFPTYPHPALPGPRSGLLTSPANIINLYIFVDIHSQIYIYIYTFVYAAYCLWPVTIAPYIHPAIFYTSCDMGCFDILAYVSWRRSAAERAYENFSSPNTLLPNYITNACWQAPDNMRQALSPSPSAYT